MAGIGVKIRVFVPKTVFNDAHAVQSIQHVMLQKTQPELRKEFEKTVRSWDNKPNWTFEHYFGVGILSVKVLTYSTQYRLVNTGAKPHPIRPRKARMLRFQNGYRAKSRPRLIGSFAGGKYGEFVTARAVHHPGFEAREFDKEIAEQYQDTFRKDIQDAITGALP